MFQTSSDSEDHDNSSQGLFPNPTLSLCSHPQIDKLRLTLSETLPYCCGTVQLPPDSYVVYYGKSQRGSRIDLSKASSASLDALEKACEPASFGVDQQNVVDESYRKARKLEKTQFSLNLDVGAAGLLDSVRTGLLSGRGERVEIHAELHKLNVYGTGSFFKAHQDTPRGTSMFGSLVVIFPTAHEGGIFTLRSEGHTWEFNAAPLVAPLRQEPPRAAYVAFFSDVEHEVGLVTSGHRVSVTYNLYFVDPRAETQPFPGLDVIRPRGAHKPEVTKTLSALLADPTFLPNGGTLGFGLRHLYALPSHFSSHDDTTLEIIAQRLKGVDSALFRACIESYLAPALYTIYEDTGSASPGSDSDGARTLVACPCVVQFDTHDYDEEQPLWEKLCAHFQGVLVHSTDTPAVTAPPAGVAARSVAWITPLSGVNKIKTQFAAYGNEPMMGYLYQRLCILVDVGPPGRRVIV